MQVTAARSRVVVRAERATWLPGSEVPDYLTGTSLTGLQKSSLFAVVIASLLDIARCAGELPGDFGFDPLRLGEDPTALKWYSVLILSPVLS